MAADDTHYRCLHDHHSQPDRQWTRPAASRQVQRTADPYGNSQPQRCGRRSAVRSQLPLACCDQHNCKKMAVL